MRRFRAVIFDIDGTLVDSNDAHAHAWEQALHEHGHAAPFERIRPLIGKGGDKLLPELTGIDAESAQGKVIADRRKTIFRQHLPRLVPTRGARRLVKRLRDEGFTLTVATSAERDEAQRLLDIAGVRRYFRASTSSDDAERSKPDPDIVHAALREIRMPPSATVMIGDTPYDIEAAARAGIEILALRCGGWWSDADLHGAAGVYDDPQDLLERQVLLDGLTRAAG
jgi:HAD superfamily hydrolase (TIGR01509 family)